jgi:hypothetical protein
MSLFTHPNALAILLTTANFFRCAENSSIRKTYEIDGGCHAGDGSFRIESSKVVVGFFLQ